MQSHWFARVHVYTTLSRAPVTNLTAVTLEETNAAKVVLEKRLGQPSWLRSIAICEAAAGLHVVKVAVSEGSIELWDQVHLTIDGVRVIVDEVGDILQR